ncbi:MAG TPA: hypothetical protein PK504_12350 [Ferruginibacter sp.]|nr:hypothetical protein [Ferruginibacter sp.]HRE64870.1 hypothetical protein [Ferruginibacter sp.]
MKKIFVIVSLLIVFHSKSVNAQSGGVTDTLSYLQTIVANKAQYIGHPFSVLYNSLQIQVKFFSPFASIPYAKHKETSTSFSYYFPTDSLNDFYLTYPKLEIFWQTPLNANLSDVIWQNNNGGGWNTNSYNFYKDAIITNLKVRE